MKGKRYSKLFIEKARSGIQKAKTRTKSRGRAATGGAVNQYPQSEAITEVVFLCEH